jgi:hypothetical protein
MPVSPTAAAAAAFAAADVAPRARRAAPAPAAERAAATSADARAYEPFSSIGAADHAYVAECIAYVREELLRGPRRRLRESRAARKERGEADDASAFDAPDARDARAARAARPPPPSVEWATAGTDRSARQEMGVAAGGGAAAAAADISASRSATDGAFADEAIEVASGAPAGTAALAGADADARASTDVAPSTAAAAAASASKGGAAAPLAASQELALAAWRASAAVAAAELGAGARTVGGAGAAAGAGAGADASSSPFPRPRRRRSSSRAPPEAAPAASARSHDSVNAEGLFSGVSALRRSWGAREVARAREGAREGVRAREGAREGTRVREGAREHEGAREGALARSQSAAPRETPAEDTPVTGPEALSLAGESAAASTSSPHAPEPASSAAAPLASAASAPEPPGTSAALPPPPALALRRPSNRAELRRPSHTAVEAAPAPPPPRQSLVARRRTAARAAAAADADSRRLGGGCVSGCVRASGEVRGAARYARALVVAAFDYRRPRAFRWPLRVRAACIVGSVMSCVVFVVFVVAAQRIAAYVKTATTGDPFAAKFLTSALAETQAGAAALQRVLNAAGLNVSECQRLAPAFNYELAAAAAGANAGLNAADVVLASAATAAGVAAPGPLPVARVPGGANLTCVDVARAFELLALVTAYRLPSLDLTGTDAALLQSAVIGGVLTLAFSLLAWATVLPRYTREILALRRGRYSFEPYFFTPDRAATLIVLCFLNSFLQFLLLGSVLTIVAFLFAWPLSRESIGMDLGPHPG